MTRHFLFVALIVVGIAAIVACEDDPIDSGCRGCGCPDGYSAAARTPPCPPQSGFRNLTTRNAVLNNIEVAYERRRLDKYDELLDPNFMFFLSGADVGGGLPRQWGRADEIMANTNLFSQTPPAEYPRCKRIQMDVQWEQGLAWTEVVPQSAPDETWYATTVYYDFKIDIEPDMTYLNNLGAKAQFTVRNAGTEDAPHWQLVEMRDLSDDSLGAGLGAAASTEPTTWGSIKAIYR